MMDDFYLVLGIGRDAGMTQIKRAYRRLSLRYHPDVAGQDALEHYDRVRQAYETLIHPTKRSDYDQTLAQVENWRGPAEGTPPLFEQPMDLLEGFGRVRPGSDEILAHLLANFTGAVPKANPTRELNVEVVLTPEQAQRGGHIVMMAPVARVCADCGGTGRAGFFVCDACTGHGTLWEKAQVDVYIPQNMQDGGVIETSLRRLGIKNMWLKTHVRIVEHHA